MTARSATRKAADRGAVTRLHKDATAVALLLGAASIRFASLPDNRFDELALLDVVKQVEAWIAELRPSAIYTHHAGDLNIDHAITARAVLTATRPVAGAPVRALYAFEVPSATDWAFQQIHPVFRPSVFVDIAATLGAKIRAMQRYAGEVRPFPHPRSPEAIEATARRWGSVAGLPAAEAFDLIREIR